MASVTEAAEGVASGARAGFFIRLAGLLVDGIVLAVVGTVLGVVLKGAAGSVLSVLVGLLYFTLLVGGRGQTVGMGAARVRVVDKNGGGNIGYGRAFLRWIGMYVSTIFIFLGYFWMLWDAENQCWHDKMANDVVVRV
jgi:uncharacterized RDD family membrane protein YckC